MVERTGPYPRFLSCRLELRLRSNVERLSNKEVSYVNECNGRESHTQSSGK
jgi:hypothetical protein